MEATIQTLEGIGIVICYASLALAGIWTINLLYEIIKRKIFDFIENIEKKPSDSNIDY